MSKDPHPLVQENRLLLDQAVHLVETLETRVYANNAVPPFNSGVGMHIRHILDFYTCFLSGMDSGCIDYDRRLRKPDVETDPAAALAGIRAVWKQLESVGEVDREILSKNDDGGHRNPEACFSPSSPGRELQFLASHTVHHYAMIAMILMHQGIRTPKTFGIAPSTLAHRAAAEA